jgi:hypothetical protein
MDYHAIFSVINAVSFAQEKTVTGVVSVMVPYRANVLVKGTKRKTDLDGKYAVKANVVEMFCCSHT